MAGTSAFRQRETLQRQWLTMCSAKPKCERFILIPVQIRIVDRIVYRTADSVTQRLNIRDLVVI